MNWNRTQNFGKCHFQIPQGSRDERLSWSSNLHTCTAALAYFDHPFKPYVIETTEGGSSDHFYSTNFSFGGGCNVFFYEKIHLTEKKFTSSPHPLTSSEDLRHFKG